MFCLESIICRPKGRGLSLTVAKRPSLYVGFQRFLWSLPLPGWWQSALYSHYELKHTPECPSWLLSVGHLWLPFTEHFVAFYPPTMPLWFLGSFGLFPNSLSTPLADLGSPPTHQYFCNSWNGLHYFQNKFLHHLGIFHLSTCTLGHPQLPKISALFQQSLCLRSSLFPCPAAGWGFGACAIPEFSLSVPSVPSTCSTFLCSPTIAKQQMLEDRFWSRNSWCLAAWEYSQGGKSIVVDPTPYLQNPPKWCLTSNPQKKKVFLHL